MELINQTNHYMATQKFILLFVNRKIICLFFSLFIGTHHAQLIYLCHKKFPLFIYLFFGLY